jgi:hypothetical protein
MMNATLPHLDLAEDNLRACLSEFEKGGQGKPEEAYQGIPSLEVL